MCVCDRRANYSFGTAERCCVFTVCRLPFGWKNPFGYIVAFIVVYIIQMNIIFCTVLFVNYGIGNYFLVKSFAIDLKNDVIAFNDRVKTEPNLKLSYKQFTDLIDFHSTLKRFENAFCIKFQFFSHT